MALLGNQYYDPYGVPPTKAITPYVKSYNTLDYQSLNQEDCGYFCMYFIDNWLAGLSPVTKLKHDEYAYNYQVLKRHFT